MTWSIQIRVLVSRSLKRSYCSCQLHVSETSPADQRLPARLSRPGTPSSRLACVSWGRRSAFSVPHPPVRSLDVGTSAAAASWPVGHSKPSVSVVPTAGIAVHAGPSVPCFFYLRLPRQHRPPTCVKGRGDANIWEMFHAHPHCQSYMTAMFCFQQCATM